VADETNIGRVYLVGAGPGDADLITCRGKNLLCNCEAVVYDSLISPEFIVCLPPKTERHYVGKQAGRHTLPQEDINKLLVKLAKQGKRVVRLKGGDPFIFGRGGEEALYLAEHGVPFEVVPGVTSGVAALAYAGIPATHRGLSVQVIFVTGHEAIKPGSGDVPWEQLARLDKGTLVGYMAVGQLHNIVDKLISSGMSPQTPAALIERGTFGTQRLVSSPLVELPTAVDEGKIKPPALFVIGDVVALREKLRWFDDLPLFGKRVMVTRPVDQSAGLYSMLRSYGADVIPLPTLYIAPEFDRRAWARVESHCHPGDWLYFASENGVRFFLQQWRQQGKDIRALSVCAIAVVGVGAREAVEAVGIVPDLIAEKATTTGLAEEMVAKLELKNRRVIRVRGNLSGEQVDRILEAGGAKVIPLVVYRTCTAKWREDESERLEKFPPDIILFSSGTAVTALVHILGEQGARKLAEDTITVSVGPATTREATAAGIPITVEAAVPSLEGQVQSLLYYLKQQ